MSTPIYMDYNATTPMHPDAKAAMLSAIGEPLNASAVHHYGRAGRKIIEDARAILAQAINIPAAQVIFNSGATEANNTVLKHFAHTYPDEQILIAATEHPSVREALPQAKVIPVDQSGIIDMDALETLLKEKTALVSVMLVNNETGVIQPIKEIASLTHRCGALLHCDATQALGRIAIDMPAMQIDFLSLSAHKIGGAQGVGALALGMCGITPTLLEGGGQEKKARAGTENVAGIASFAAAITAEKNNAQIQKWRDEIEATLMEIDPRTIIFGKNTQRVGNTTLFALRGLSSETLMMRFDLEGIALSNGSACSSGTVKGSSVLLAMGYDEETAKAALRISLGWNTTQSDIDRFIEVWKKIHAQMKDKVKDA